MYVYVCVYIYIYICIYIYIYIYICLSAARGGSPRSREFKDVVFEDVVF